MICFCYLAQSVLDLKSSEVINVTVILQSFMLIFFHSITSKTAGNDNHRLTQWFCNEKVYFVTFDTCMFYRETVSSLVFFLKKKRLN